MSIKLQTSSWLTGLKMGVHFPSGAACLLRTPKGDAKRVGYLCVFFSSTTQCWQLTNQSWQTPDQRRMNIKLCKRKVQGRWRNTTSESGWNRRATQLLQVRGTVRGQVQVWKALQPDGLVTWCMTCLFPKYYMAARSPFQVWILANIEKCQSEWMSAGWNVVERVSPLEMWKGEGEQSFSHTENRKPSQDFIYSSIFSNGSFTDPC